MSHPASEGLRQLADWLDANGEGVRFDGVSLRLVKETPEGFAALVEATAARRN